MDRLAVMQAFCRIVERGSFARAAEDLGVSPALLSQDLKRLEQRLGYTHKGTESLMEGATVARGAMLIADINPSTARLPGTSVLSTRAGDSMSK